MLDVELTDQPITFLRNLSLGDRLKILQKIDQLSSRHFDQNVAQVVDLNPEQFQVSLDGYRITYTLGRGILRILILSNSSSYLQNCRRSL